MNTGVWASRAYKRFIPVHICARSTQDRRNETACSFRSSRKGCRHGDKCLCLVDDVAPATVQDQLEGPATSSRPHRVDQLNVDVASSVYLQSGQFSVEHITSFLATRLSEATERFPLLRAAGEMSWVLPMPIGADDFFVYESAVNDIVADAPAIFMRLYDLQRFSAQMLVDILHTHPQVLLDDNLIDNRHYLPPRSTSREDRPPIGLLRLPRATHWPPFRPRPHVRRTGTGGTG